MNNADVEKICQMTHTITKLDTRFFDLEGKTHVQFVNHVIPVVLDPPESEYVPLMESLQQQPSDHFYHHTNNFGLEYISVGVWEKQTFQGCLLIGPFVSNISIFDLIKDKISENRIPISERKQLEQFYQALLVLSDTECESIGTMVINLCEHRLVHTKQAVSPLPKPTIKDPLSTMSIEENVEIIEQRYQQQNQLMHAISKGDKEAVNHLVNYNSPILAFSDRIPGSPIRSSKNISFTTNTLFRLAAERSGVHPVYLHNISERFAILIERTTTIPKLQKLNVLMANEYCDLVITHATGHYSQIVKKAVDYIQLHLGEYLTLKHIAEQIHVNPSHLSRKFKEETKMTVTDFINQKRVEEAKLYLRRGSISITDIAFMIGYNDLNYFSKVFKKWTSLTPSQYTKGEHGEDG
ncbi:AraC family transcriptional regulator [Gracilibacillus sp. YIM 98692]|uniref:helix-turn-helix domain-containing protein n=1 Tax=Gracilibacillus sp. YIM 98692 TaxID=2663532 RepID=UPI0013D55F3D|nr:AraC family transcriptional regulator [Gracilibacillus sp. YIM 98692]